MYATGIRVSELVNIKKQDIDFYANGVTVSGSGAKSVLYRLVLIVDKASKLFRTFQTNSVMQS
ncbi:tyrosine-type recombinase/integrase [Staphylococcus aureus]